MSLPPASLFVRGLGYAALAVAMTAVAGCASHPKPAPAAVAQAAPPPARPAPAPYHEPAPSVSTAPLPGSERDFVVNVGDRVYFDYNKFNVRSDAEALLAAQASWLQRYPAVQVRIEGNCDERGTEQYNLALGARRANSVKAFLVSHGVADGRISTVSYGKEKPIDTGEGEQAWEHNRNGHTAILSGAR